MKHKWVCMVIILCLMIVLFRPSLTIAQSGMDDAFDGYLVCVSESEYAMLMEEQLNDISPISRIVRAENLEEAGEICKKYRTEYVEPNYIANLFAEETSKEISNGWAYTAVSADYPLQYGLDGSGVRIGVIDSGIDKDNPDLRDAYIDNGFDYIKESAAMTDDIYHGTAIAQIIAADRNGSGSTGIAAGVTLVPLRCFSSKGGGTVQLIARAIYDAVDIYKCDVINMSWGIRTDSEALYNAIRYAYESGVILVAACGNVGDKYSQGSKAFPAAYDEVISVSAADSDKNILESSLANDKVMICAPGGEIPVINAEGTAYTVNGTSFAAPFITAEAAIIKQLAPSLDPDTVIEVMTQRAEDLGSEGKDKFYGYGFVGLDSLISTSWSRMNENRLQGWCVNKGGCRITGASFDRKGKAIEIQQTKTDSDYLEFNGLFESVKNETYLILYTDSGYTPLSESSRY